MQEDIHEIVTTFVTTFTARMNTDDRYHTTKPDQNQTIKKLCAEFHQVQNNQSDLTPAVQKKGEK